MTVLRRPNLFIVGAPKSGSTSLHRYLQQHPQIFMSRTKEPRYFAPDVVGSRPEHSPPAARTEPDYLALFANANNEQRYIGEYRQVVTSKSPEQVGFGASAAQSDRRGSDHPQRRDSARAG